MLRENATVISTDRDTAKVAITRSEACGHCPAKSSCSAASGEINVLQVANPAGARPGERVIIELPPDQLVRATASVYLLPAVAMVAGATAGWLPTGSDLWAMFGAVAGLAASSLALYIRGRRKKDASGPAISEVLSRRRPEGTRAA